MDLKKENSLNFVNENRIYIHGEFDDTISKHVIPDFVKIIMQHSVIEIYISSDGGKADRLKDLLGSATTGRVLNDKELERSQDRVKSHFDFIRSIYKKHASIENLEEAIMYDNYSIRGQDIIKNGLADKFIND